MEILEVRVPACINVKKDYDSYRKEASGWFNGKATEAAKKKLIDSYKQQDELENLNTGSLEYLNSHLLPYTGTNGLAAKNIAHLIEREKEGKTATNLRPVFLKDKEGNLLFPDAVKLLMEKYEAFKPYENVKRHSSQEAMMEKYGRELISVYNILQDYAAMEKSKTHVEPGLAEYFKLNPKMKTALQDFRRAQEQWLKARVKGKGIAEAETQMLFARKEFTELYKPVALKKLKEMKEGRKQAISDVPLKDFIGAMMEKFTYGKMFRVFKFSAMDYMPKGEELPEEYKKEMGIKEQKNDE